MEATLELSDKGKGKDPGIEPQDRCQGTPPPGAWMQRWVMVPTRRDTGQFEGGYTTHKARSWAYRPR